MNTQKKSSLLSNRMYNALKWITLLVIPAIGTFYMSLSTIWNFPAGEQVLSTTVALNLFLGTILGLSTRSYNKTEAKYDGDIRVDNRYDAPEEAVVAELDTPLDEVATKDEVVLKVQPPIE